MTIEMKRVGLVLWLVGCQQSGGLAAIEGDQPGECSDGIDNDFDEAADCLDEDCSEDPDCQNAVPTLPEIHIDPQDPGPGQQLTCVVDAAAIDAEGSDLEYQFSWFVDDGDGVQNPADQASLAVDGAMYANDTVAEGVTEAGQTWTCSLVVSDGEDSTEAVTDSVLIRSACSDLNCDGLPDIAFTNFIDDAGNVMPTYFYYGSQTGYDASNRAELSTAGAVGISVADLDRDGFQDVVVANQYVGSNYRIDSGIFWGTATGYSSADRTGLPTIGALGNVVVDLDQDGHLDIIYLNRYDGYTYDVPSYIYWGSASGFSSTDRVELPTSGVGDVKVADLNQDGINDIVALNFFDTSSDPKDTQIFWGTTSGWDMQNPTILNSGSGDALALGDLDNDGWPEIVVGAYDSSSADASAVKIFWGSPSGHDESDVTSFPASHTFDLLIEDLNNDGYSEIVVATLLDLDELNIFEADSYVYWGSAAGHSLSDRTVLRTTSATSVEAADLDADGHIDLVFSSLFGDLSTFESNGHIFWGDASGYSDSNFTLLETVASFDLAIAGG